MKILVLYDNNANNGFASGWGLSLLIDGKTLFDTGNSTTDLVSNMQALKVDPMDIDRLIISHDDWDHTGGISILKDCGNVDVYLPASASFKLKNDILQFNANSNIIEVTDPVNVGSNMLVTQMLGEAKKEISLAVFTGRGQVLVTGCAHPGLENIMESVRRWGRIHAVFGGFHDFSNLEALADVDRIYPCHCTKMRNEIKEEYPDKVQLISVGQEITIGDGKDDGN